MLTLPSVYTMVAFLEISVYIKTCCSVPEPCSTLCNPVDCSPPGFSVHEILQARILEWVAMPSSRGSSRPRDRTQVSHFAGFFTTEPPGKPHINRVSPKMVNMNQVLSSDKCREVSCTHDYPAGCLKVCRVQDAL